MFGPLKCHVFEWHLTLVVSWTYLKNVKGLSQGSNLFRQWEQHHRVLHRVLACRDVLSASHSFRLFCGKKKKRLKINFQSPTSNWHLKALSSPSNSIDGNGNLSRKKEGKIVKGKAEEIGACKVFSSNRVTS